MKARVGLALIAKNEADNLPRLLASVEGAFDRVVLLDTGSTDDTVGVFQAWAKAQAGLTFSVGHFDWRHDFAAARIAADELLLGAGEPMVEWKAWADCDDTIVGAEKLRTIAAQADPGAGTFVFGYDYAQHPDTGACVCHLVRERLIRVAGAPQWVGRVHEATPGHMGVVRVPDEQVRWVHHKQHDQAAAVASNTRNLEILRAWNADEPNNPRVVGYLGTELAVSGAHEEALSFFQEYMDLPTGWDEERAQIARKYAASLLALGRVEDARLAAVQGIVALPDWPDSYFTLAEVALYRGEFDVALKHADRALALGTPQTLLIINPLEYAIAPHALRAQALVGLKRWDDAREAAARALAVEPSNIALAQLHAQAAGQAKREHTAQTYVMAARQLIAHDEQMKARAVLECVPHFAYDHPAVVGVRAEVARRLAWVDDPRAYDEHYETGGSKPEDFHGDEKIVELCQHLPRVNFLIGGLLEQAA